MVKVPFFFSEDVIFIVMSMLTVSIIAGLLMPRIRVVKWRFNRNFQIYLTDMLAKKQAELSLGQLDNATIVNLSRKAYESYRRIEEFVDVLNNASLSLF